MSLRVCAVSVDLDEIPKYASIHGLPAPGGPAATAVYDVAVERLCGLARAHGLPVTWFVVGADVDRAHNAERLRSLAEGGDEIANHTLDHRYDLTRLGRREMERQVRLAMSLLEDATGERPRGFRAPGYVMSDELVEVLRDSGVEYDSSVFPCPAYYAAKAVAVVGHRVRGRRSGALLGDPAVLRAPTQPYRTGVRYWRRGKGMLELPVQVTPHARLPYIGTSLTLLGPDRARWLTRRVAKQGFVNLELHGMDALDVQDGLEDLGDHQFDLRVAVARKLDALAGAVETLREAGYAFVRLDEAARTVGV